MPFNVLFLPPSPYLLTASTRDGNMLNVVKSSKKYVECLDILPIKVKV